MNKIISVLYFLVLVIGTGCVEEMEIEPIDNSERKLVVDGLISNEDPPYFFRVTQTARFNEKLNIGIEDAQLIISDNTGVKDTLQPLVSNFDHVNESYPYYLRTFFNHYTQKLDGFPFNIADDMVESTAGFYATNRIRGKEGNTYTLTINYKGKTYEATETMPVATPIDSLWFQYKKLSSKEGYFLCPIINFKNTPNKPNHYLFTYNKMGVSSMISSPLRVWQISVLSDEYLPEDIKNFNLNDGETVRGYEEGFNFIFSEGYETSIYMHSITASCYSYYSDLIRQMRFDGGLYTPTPITTRGNISNGALGFFNVSAVSVKTEICVPK
ncbi:MAG: DUF4249 family protein [Macellibacteroides fermentans]|uniref:DUF4249 family protein n=1 Tax=Macellibacteroides fermentans TaxID=879969 RepID=UPI003AD4B0CB